MCIRDRLSALNIVSRFVLICICSGISLFSVLCLYICKFSHMFIMVPLCGICFISVALVMSGNYYYIYYLALYILYIIAYLT